MWRISNYLYKKKFRILAGMIFRMIRFFFSCEIPPSIIVGKGTLFIHNGLGCVVHPKAIIGKNCRIYQNVTIGGRNGRGTPILKDGVFVGPGACILGGVIIEKNVVIGANTVVLHNVMEGKKVVCSTSREL